VKGWRQKHQPLQRHQRQQKRFNSLVQSKCKSRIIALQLEYSLYSSSDITPSLFKSARSNCIACDALQLDTNRHTIAAALTLAAMSWYEEPPCITHYNDTKHIQLMTSALPPHLPLMRQKRGHLVDGNATVTVLQRPQTSRAQRSRANDT
jgi:hypothetical protein